MENIAVKKQDADIYTQVLTKINNYQNSGEIALPANYNAGNAIKNAQLAITEVVSRDKKPALEVCTKASIAQALLDTVLQGLNPGKKQCYYIVYGNKLVMQRSRYGEEHVAKSVCPEIEGIYPEVVYKGDVFEYSKKRGRTVIEKHLQSIDNVSSGEMIAAYCTIVFKDGHEETTIMTIAEIYSSWKMSRQSPFDDKGNLKPSSTHAMFPAEMAKRTVVRRACKPIINSSDDSNLLIVSINRTADAASDAETDALIDENNGIVDVDINDEVAAVDTATGEVIETQRSETVPY